MADRLARRTRTKRRHAVAEGRSRRRHWGSRREQWCHTGVRWMTPCNMRATVPSGHLGCAVCSLCAAPLPRRRAGHGGSYLGGAVFPFPPLFPPRRGATAGVDPSLHRSEISSDRAPCFCTMSAPPKFSRTASTFVTLDAADDIEKHCALPHPTPHRANRHNTAAGRHRRAIRTGSSQNSGTRVHS